MESKKQTYNKIFDAAKRVFVEKGFYGARTQGIADEGGVNKALLHYYFESKEKLFEVTYKDSSEKLFGLFNDILSRDTTLSVKIDQFVDEVSKFLFENRLVAVFVFAELNGGQRRNIENFVSGIKYSDIFKNQVESELEKISQDVQTDAEIFYSMMLSLTLFPFLAKPFIMLSNNIDEIGFSEFLRNHSSGTKKILHSYLKKGVKQKQNSAVENVKDKKGQIKEPSSESSQNTMDYNLFDDPSQYKLF